MIGCQVFRKKLNDLLEESISGDLRYAMEEHIKSCERCRKLYEKECIIDNALRDTVYSGDAGFKSSREQIIKNIDKNRYGKSPLKKLYFNIRKNILSYSVCAALAVLCIISAPYWNNILEFSRPFFDDTGFTNPSGSIGSTSGDPLIDEKPADPGETLNGNDSTPDSVVETELPVPGTVKDKSIEAVLNKISSQSMGAVPWNIGFAGDGRFVFYNYSALLAYSASGENPGFYGAVDLQEISCSYMQGSVVTRFDFSPDGGSAVIWNHDIDGGFKDTQNIYIYDLTANKSKVITRDSTSAIVGSWSPDSCYYAFGYYDGSSITVFDRNSNTSMSLPFNEGNIQKIFVSDDGDVMVLTNKKYILQEEDNYSCMEISVPGEVLKFSSPDNILCFDNGAIYQLNQNGHTKTKEIGENFKLINNPDRTYAIFTDGVSTVVYNYYLGDFYKYNFPYEASGTAIFSPDLKKCYMPDGSNAKVITYTGKEIELNGSGDWAGMLGSMWLDNDSLIRIVQKNPDTLGGFALYKTDLVSTKKDSLSGQDSTDVLSPSDIVKKYYAFTSEGKYLKAWELIHPLSKAIPYQGTKNLIKDSFLSLEGTKGLSLTKILNESMLDSYRMHSNRTTYDDVAEVQVELSNGDTRKIHLVRDGNNNWGLFWDPETGIN